MSAVSAPVDRFLDAVLHATIDDCDAWSPDVRLDATVPNWRFHRSGPDAVRATYRTWFADPGSFEELRRLEVPGGEVVEYTLTWTENGTAYTAHHLHLLSGDASGIREDIVLCGGRWPAALRAEMVAADLEVAGA